MKFFLSHSSSDKIRYVKYVADKLGDRAVYDEYTFESGMETLSEIYRTMSDSDVFVLFISDAALNSDWVKREVTQSRNLLDNDKLKRFLPILIDKNISHNDPRIPKWISETYNIRLVNRPAVALRRINTVFTQVSLSKHPSFDKPRQLFVGRNNELRDLEKRFDDYTKSVPGIVFVSGMREVGRKTFAINALKKTNRVDKYYDPIKISLRPEDGIEGIISKIYDLGIYSGDRTIDRLSSISMTEKIDILVDLLSDFSRQNEILLVDDWRSIVHFGGELANWFLEVSGRLPQSRTVMAVASAYAPRFEAIKGRDDVYSVRLRELDPDERMGLLVRYLRDVAGRPEINSSDFGAFKNVLNGYPEQAIFAAQLIADAGLKSAINRMPEVVEFSSVKSSVYVSKYIDNEDQTEFLTFISWFDFISFDLLEKIQSRVEFDILDFVSELIQESICDTIGSVGEYVRLNDIIRDYVSRGSLQIPVRYAKVLRDLSRDIFESNDYSIFDYSEKSAAVRISLLEGKSVPDSLLIPAHFLGAISQNYKNRKYENVISLSDQILPRDNYEDYIRSQIRFYLCMSLARTRNNRFMSEVHKVKGADHNYILGFYYRRIGRYDLALERLERAITEHKWQENAKREIVLIHNIMEEYDKAFLMAKESYHNSPTNAINVQAYFEILINVSRTADILDEMNSTLESISKINTDKGEEVSYCMRGQYAFHVERDVGKAYAILDEGIARFPASPYPLLAKLEIAVSIKNPYDIRSFLNQLRRNEAADYQARSQVIKADIIATALEGNKGKALARINSELDFIFPAARERFRSRISSL